MSYNSLEGRHLVDELFVGPALGDGRAQLGFNFVSP